MTRLVSSISTNAIREKDPYATYYPVVVAGAGESGIAVGCQLKEKLGLDEFRIFDRQGGIGGTWYINKYPGVACDIPALFYSYSFAPNYQWTSLFPPGSEILSYLQNVCKKFQIVKNIQLNTEVSEACWLEDEEEWEITLRNLAPYAGDLSETDRQIKIKEHGANSVYLQQEVVRAKIFISCAGELVEPKPWPQHIPGIESFKGDVFHSARWNINVNLKDKDVVVVGTGCTAAQIVPCLTKAPFHAKSVTQLMRSPPWVFPRPQTPEIWQKYSPRIIGAVPGLGRILRFLLFLYAEATWLSVGTSGYSTKRRERFQKRLLTHLKTTVPERYQRILTPDFGVGCKRIIIDNQWFHSLNQPNMELTTRPIVSVQAAGITLGPVPSILGSSGVDDISNTASDQVEKHADAIVLANGFETATYLHRLKVRGTGGKVLQEVWDERGGPQAYLSTAVDGFPNFLIILGPNAVTGHSSAILASENTVMYGLNFIRPVLRGDATTFQVKKEAEIRYTADVQARSKTKVWMGCKNGYISEHGWNSAICPYNQIHFTLMCMFPRWSDWEIKYTAKALQKQRLRQFLTYASIAIGTTALLQVIKTLWLAY